MRYSSAYQKLHSWRADVAKNASPKPNGRSAEYGAELDVQLAAAVRAELESGLTWEEGRLRTMLVNMLKEGGKVRYDT